MHKKAKVNLKGSLQDHEWGGYRIFNTTVLAKDLVELLSIPEISIVNDDINLNLNRPINRNRALAFEKQLLSTIQHGAACFFPQVSAVSLNAVIKKNASEKEISQLVMTQDQTYIVQGIHLLVAICNILGKKVLGLTSARSKNQTPTYPKDVVDRLREVPIQIILFFDTKKEKDEKDIIELLKACNTIDPRVHSIALSTVNSDNNLVAFVERLIDETEIVRISTQPNSSSLTEFRDNTISHTCLLELVLAVLGGKSFRVKADIPTHLPDGTEITEELLNTYEQPIVSFLSAWKASNSHKSYSNKVSFQNSSQVWQALGLVIHELLKVSPKDSLVFKESGEHLGNLDYGKNARHWKDCKAFKLGVDGKTYINATGGGRSMRDKLADYFMKRLSENIKN